MTFSSAMIPKTTNKTAGNTPFPAFAMNLKRKLDYSSSGKTVRKVKRGNFLSVNASMNKNKLFYDVLPDGVVCFYPAKGHPSGPYGYLAPLLNALTDGLSDVTSKYSEFPERLNVTSILPIADLNTGLAKKILYANGTKDKQQQAIVYVFDNSSDSTDGEYKNCDQICTNLVREAAQTFNVNISFGGNSAAFGLPVPTSIDAKFLPEDVANLAMMCYTDSIMDGSFFKDESLVRQYFQYCPDVKDLFSKLFGN